MLLGDERVGTLVAINRALQLSERDSTLSQIKNQSPDSRTREPKVMGSKLARQIEGAMKKPAGWMDTDPDLEWPFETIPAGPYRQLSERIKGMVEMEVRRVVRDVLGASAWPAAEEEVVVKLSRPTPRKQRRAGA